MARRNSDEPTPLLSEELEQEIKREQMDIEDTAGREEAPKGQNLDHEYTIPSHVKFAWLGTYFFFSLLLTLYNKLVLGMVGHSHSFTFNFSALSVPRRKGGC